MSLTRNAFPSRVARRVFVAFLVASMLPLLLFAAGAYRQVTSELLQAGLTQVRHQAKRNGLATFDQLVLVRDQLQMLAGLSAPGDAAAVRGIGLGERAERVFWVPPQGPADGLEPRLSQRLRESQLVTERRSVQVGAAILSDIYVAVPAAGGWRLVAKLDTRRLWSRVGVTGLAERFCLLDVTGEPIFCNQPVPDNWMQRMHAAALERQPAAKMAIQDGAMLSAVWRLFLKPNFGVSYWHFAVGAPEHLALRPIERFQNLFPLAALLVLGGSLLAGIRLVRANLQPLERLRQAAVRLGRGDFAARAAVSSDDEFEQVGSAFDQAAENLGRNFEQMQAMNELDRRLRNVDSVQQALRQALPAIVLLGRCECLALLRMPDVQGLLALRSSDDASDDGEQLPAGELPCEAIEGPLSVLEAQFPFLRRLQLAAEPYLHLFPVGHEEEAALLLVDAQLQDGAHGMVQRMADTVGMVLRNLALTRQLFFQAKHDSLTGLLNRVGVAERFPALLRGMRAQRGAVAVLIFDLDHFKDVNDSLGHAAGDQLLVAIAQRLQERLAGIPDVIPSRFSGDEFVILLGCPAGGGALAEVSRLAALLGSVFAEPFEVYQRSLDMTASSGVALCDAQARCDLADLLQKADVAMYQAKTTHSGELSIYDERLSQRLRERLDLEHGLKHALAQEELRVFYQPVVDAATATVVGAEALLRWRCDGDLVMPGTFVPVAEDIGLIKSFGLWVFRKVCEDLVRWGIRADDFHISVNLSAKQIVDRGLPRLFAEVLQQTGADPACLALEVTETAMMRDFVTATQVLGELRQLGLRLLVDDFGTGHASLKYLRNLPVDGIKVDRLFVKDLPDSDRDRAIVSAVAVLATDLDLRVVAEGVETGAQRDCLLAQGLTVMQGFLFHRPMPAAQFQGDILPLLQAGAVDTD